MARLFRGHEDAVARSLEIVERCRFSLDELRYEYPEEPVPRDDAAAAPAELTGKGRERFERLSPLGEGRPREGAVSADRGLDSRRGKGEDAIPRQGPR